MTTIRVYGTPAPQGSKKAFIRGGRVNLVESSKAVKPWREAVKLAADSHAGALPEGPVTVAISFVLPRGKSIPKTRSLPWKKPDIDKLVRSTLDALTDAGVWKDDAQVIDLTASKYYEDAISKPGAIISFDQMLGGIDEGTEQTSRL